MAVVRNFGNLLVEMSAVVPDGIKKYNNNTTIYLFILLIFLFRIMLFLHVIFVHGTNCSNVE